MTRFTPDSEDKERAEVISARLPMDIAKEFYRLCKANDMKVGTMARQMLTHCIKEMLDKEKKQ